MRCANATAMDRSRRDESSATSIVQIGRGVTELWPFKVFPAVCLFAERLDGPIVREKAGIFTCARVRRAGRLRGTLNGRNSGTPRPICAIQVPLEMSRPDLSSATSTRQIGRATQKFIFLKRSQFNHIYSFIPGSQFGFKYHHKYYEKCHRCPISAIEVLLERSRRPQADAASPDARTPSAEPPPGPGLEPGTGRWLTRPSLHLGTR